MKSKSHFSVFAILLALSGCAKIVVVPVPQTPTLTPNGVFYALPKTVARVSMNIEKNTYQLARYQKFGAIFAPEIDPICKTFDCTEEKTKTFSLKDATLSSFGEPDPGHVYMVKFSGGWAFDQAISMTWNESGIPATASATVTNRSADIALAALKAAAGLTMKGFGFGGGRDADNTAKAKCADSSKTDDWVLPILAPPHRKVFWRYLVDNYCAIAKDEREKWQEEKDKELLGEAVEAYDARVSDLVSKRLELLSANANNYQPDAMITRLEADIKTQLKALYIGTKVTKLWNPIVEVRDLDLGKDISILLLDAQSGACLQPGVPLAVDAKPLPPQFTAKTCPGTKVNLKLVAHPANQLADRVKAGVKPVSGTTSFVYRIPAQAQATVTFGGEQAGASNLFVAQFGTIAALPARHNSKTLTYDLAFIEATGGLKSFKLDSKGGFEAGTVDSLSGIGGSILDARAKEAAKSDELVLLTREQAIAEAKKKICDAMTGLNAPCPYKQ